MSEEKFTPPSDGKVFTPPSDAKPFTPPSDAKAFTPPSDAVVVKKKSDPLTSGSGGTTSESAPGSLDFSGIPQNLNLGATPNIEPPGVSDPIFQNMEFPQTEQEEVAAVLDVFAKDAAANSKPFDIRAISDANDGVDFQTEEFAKKTYEGAKRIFAQEESTDFRENVLFEGRNNLGGKLEVDDNINKSYANYDSYLFKYDRERWENIKNKRESGRFDEMDEFAYFNEVANNEIETVKANLDEYIKTNYQENPYSQTFRQLLEKYPEDQIVRDHVTQAISSSESLQKFSQSNFPVARAMMEDRAANQKKADDRYQKYVDEGGFWEDVPSGLEFNYVVPVYKALLEAGRGMVSIGRSMTYGDENSVQQGINDMSNWLYDYFEPEKQMHLITPTQLQQSAVKKAGEGDSGFLGTGYTTTEALLPKTIGGLTSTLTLLSGAGGIGNKVSKLGFSTNASRNIGLMTSSYALENSRKYSEFLEMAGPGSEKIASEYANYASLLTGALETIAPNKLFFGEGASRTMTRSLINSLTKGTSKKKAFAEFTTKMLKELGEEELQEMTQLLADGLVEKGFNEQVLGMDDHGLDITPEEVGETMVITLINTALLSGPGAVASSTRSSIDKQANYWAGMNKEKFLSVLEKKKNSGQMSEDRVQVLTEHVEQFEKIINGLPSDLSEAQKVEMADAVFRKEALKKKHQGAIVDQSVKQQDQVDKELVDREINDIQEGKEKKENINPPVYKLGDKTYKRRGNFTRALSNPKNQESIRSGALEVAVENDPEMEAYMEEKFPPKEETKAEPTKTDQKNELQKEKDQAEKVEPAEVVEEVAPETVQEKEEEIIEAVPEEAASGFDLQLDPEVLNDYNRDRRENALGKPPTILQTGIEKMINQAKKNGDTSLDLKGLSAREIIQKRGNINTGKMGQQTTAQQETQQATQQETQQEPVKPRGKAKVAEGLEELSAALGSITNVQQQNPLKNPNALNAVKKIAEGLIEEGFDTIDALLTELSKRLSTSGISKEQVDDIKDDLSSSFENRLKSQPVTSSEKKPSKRKKRFEQRGLKEFADNQELLDAIEANGLTYEPVQWKKVDPIANEIVNAAIENDSLDQLREDIARTTNQEYRDNEDLSTLHAQVYHKVIDYYRRNNNPQKFSAWYNDFSNTGRYQGRFIAAMAQEASPEAIANNAINAVMQEANEKLKQQSDTGLTAEEEIKKIKETLAITQKESEAIIAGLKDEINKVKKKLKQQAPKQAKVEFVPATGDKLKDIRAKRKQAVNKLRQGLAESRGQLNMGLPLNQTILSAVRDIINTYIEEGLYRLDQIRNKVVKLVKAEDPEIADIIAEGFEQIYDQSPGINESQRQTNKKDAFIEAIERRAKSILSESQSKKKTPEDILLNTLLAKVKNDLGLHSPKKQADKNKIIEEMKIALENKDFSDAVWATAMDNVRTWVYEQGIDRKTAATIINSLEDSIDNFMSKPFPNSKLRKAIQTGAKDLGQEIEKIVKQHYTTQNKEQKTLSDKLVEMLNLPEELAEEFEKMVVKEVKKLYEEKKLAGIRQMYNLDKNLNPKEKKDNVNKRVIDRIIAGINLGSLDNISFQQFFAEKFGLLPLDNKAIEKLQRLNNLIHAHEGSEMSRRYMKEMMDYIESLKGYNANKISQIIQSMTIRGLLNAVSTITVNIPIGSYQAYFANTLPLFLSNPRAYVEFRKAWKKSGLNGIGRKSFMDVMKSGYNILDEGGAKFDERIDTRGDMVDYWLNNYDAKEMTQRIKDAKTAKEKFAHSVTLMMRSLMMIHKLSNFAKAFDTIINHRGAEMKQFMDQYNKMAKDLGVSKTRLQFDSKAAETVLNAVEKKMGYDKLYDYDKMEDQIMKEYNNDPGQAETEAEYRARRMAEMEADNINNRVEKEIDQMKSRGETIPQGYKERRTKELLEETRERNDVERALEWVKTSTLMEAPQGFTGHMYSAFIKAMSGKETDSRVSAYGKMAIKLSLGLFLRISVTSMQRAIESIPAVGLLAPGIFWDHSRVKNAEGKEVWRTDWQKNLDPTKIAPRVAINLMTTALTTAAVMSMFDWDDEEDKLVLDDDRWIDITGAGTDSYDTETLNELNPNGTIRERKDFMLSVKINDEWFDLVPARLSPQLLPVIGLIGSMRDEARLDKQKFMDKTFFEQITSGFDELQYGLTEQSFATVPRFFKKLVYKTQKDAASGFFQTLFESVAQPLRAAVYPNINRDLWNEYQALRGKSKRSGTATENFLFRDIYMADEFFLDARTDVFGYEIKRNLKTVAALKNNPLVNLAVDNFTDFRNINEERLDQEAWQMKMKHYPDVDLKSYWASNEITEDRELKVLGARVFGEEMRKFFTKKMGDSHPNAGMNKIEYYKTVKKYSDQQFRENILEGWRTSAREKAKRAIKEELENRKK